MVQKNKKMLLNVQRFLGRLKTKKIKITIKLVKIQKVDFYATICTRILTNDIIKENYTNGRQYEKE